MSVFLRRYTTRTWLLWLLGVAVLGSAAAGLGDPGLWILLLDPELVAVTVLIGLALLRENGRVALDYVLAMARGLFARARDWKRNERSALRE